MPISCSEGKAKYRVKTTKSGKKIRLAFCDNKVVEAKSLKAKAKKRGKLGS